MTRKTLSIGLICFFSASVAFAEPTIEDQLSAFEKDSKAFMNQPPIRLPVQNADEAFGSLFSIPQIKDKDYVTQRIELYKRSLKLNSKDGTEVTLENLLDGRAADLANDRAEHLVVIPQNEMLTNLNQIENQGLLSAELDESPWSDNYWPIYQGILGARYGDRSFPENEDWMVNFNYTETKPFSEYLGDRQPRASSVDLLSPAEKYDILVGDKEMGLTKAMWVQGRSYYDNGGKVESWMGICHGWAPASFMMNRPNNAVDVMAADGKTKIKFYPSDIKALASLLWAETSPRVNFAGGRCNTKNPKMDKNGRIKDQNCFDTNPRTWHLAMVNQIGVAKKSFVMDATFDYEVWNQPVYKYSYTYFNPITKKSTRTLEGAMVKLSDYKDDKFADYRNSRGNYVVGVAMEAYYVVETEPSHRTSDSPEMDAIKKVRYLYDLEVDKKGEIYGGEWYQNIHPDFLWTPRQDAKALSLIESDYPRIRKQLEKTTWSGNEPLPEVYRESAISVSPERQPLARIVEQLIDISRLGQAR